MLLLMSVMSFVLSFRESRSRPETGALLKPLSALFPTGRFHTTDFRSRGGFLLCFIWELDGIIQAEPTHSDGLSQTLYSFTIIDASGNSCSKY